MNDLEGGHDHRSVDEESQTPPSKKVKKCWYQQAFKKEWLDDVAFKDWLTPVENDKYHAICSVCNSLLKNCNRSALTLHGASSKHVKKFAAMKGSIVIEPFIEDPQNEEVVQKLFKKENLNPTSEDSEEERIISLLEPYIEDPQNEVVQKLFKKENLNPTSEGSEEEGIISLLPDRHKVYSCTVGMDGDLIFKETPRPKHMKNSNSTPKLKIGPSIGNYQSDEEERTTTTDAAAGEVNCKAEIGTERRKICYKRKIESINQDLQIECLKLEREKLNLEIIKLEEERKLLKQKYALEIDKLKAEKEKVVAEKGEECKRLKQKHTLEIDKLKAEKEKVMAEKEKVIAEKDKVVTEKEKVVAEKDKVVADIDFVKLNIMKLKMDLNM